MGLNKKKTCFPGFVNNKAADHSLISAFVIHVMESIISYLATSKISIFQLVSAADQTGLSLNLSETPKTGFVPLGPYSADVTWPRFLAGFPWLWIFQNSVW